MVCSANSLKDKYPVIYIPILLEAMTHAPQVDVLVYKPKSAQHISAVSQLCPEPLEGTHPPSAMLLSCPPLLLPRFRDRVECLQLLTAVAAHVQAEHPQRSTGVNNGDRLPRRVEVGVPRTIRLAHGIESLQHPAKLWGDHLPEGTEAWIIKPRRSDDHKLHVVFSEEGVRRACTELIQHSKIDQDTPELIGAIAQPLVPHFGVCVKVYVFFDHVYLDYRVSVPVIKDKIAAGEEHLPLHEPSKSKVAEEKLQEFLASGMMPTGIENLFAQAMRSLFGVHTFGIDFIVEEHSGRVVLIDLNYAPGFKNLPDCNPMFEALCNKVKNPQTR